MPVGDDHDAFAEIAGVTNLVGLSVFKLETRGGTPRVCRLSRKSLPRAESGWGHCLRLSAKGTTEGTTGEGYARGLDPT
jgi:hypothetical protein